jgi:DNA-binding transcriptional ArsR family regulator
VRYSEAASCAEDVTLFVTHNLEKTLSSTALMLFRALHQIALEVAATRGYAPSVSQVSYFCPLEAVALALGVHRSTVYRAAAELRAAGLVDVRGHFTTYRGRTRSDGSVWCVRLRPVGGCRARLSYGDLRRQYRNLGADVEAGRTVWAALEQSRNNPEKAGVDFEVIRRWALSPTQQDPVMSDCSTTARRSLEAVLDAQHAPREARSAAVDLAAQALAQALSDRGGVNFYRRLMWALLRRSDATGEDYSYSVYLAAQRAAVDSAEGFARRPGALFVSRLKRAGWWGEVWAAPPSRVGV